MSIKNIIERLRTIINDEDSTFNKKYDRFITESSKTNSSLYFSTAYYDYLINIRSPDSSLKYSNYNMMNSFAALLNEADNFLLEDLEYLKFFLNFMYSNMSNKNNYSFSSDIKLGFNIEDDIIYLSVPLIFADIKNVSSKRSKYELENINIVINKNKITVDNKKVKNLRSYLIYRYIELFKIITKDTLNEDIVFENIESKYLTERFESYQKIIEIVNH